MRSYTTRKKISVDDGSQFIDLYYDVKMTRKPSYYINTFVWPSFLITCLSIIGTFAPTTDDGERIEKVTMGLTTLLTMAVVLMIVTDQMPKSSNGMPLLGMELLLFNRSTEFDVIQFLICCSFRCSSCRLFI